MPTGHPATVGTLPASKIISTDLLGHRADVAAGPILADQIVIVKLPGGHHRPDPADVHATRPTSRSTAPSTARSSSRSRCQARGWHGTGHELADVHRRRRRRRRPTSPTSTSTSPTSTSTSSTTSSATVGPTSTSTTQAGATVLPTKLTASSGVSAGLAFTGANIGPLLVTSLLLLGGGLVFAMAGRKPRGDRKH